MHDSSTCPVCRGQAVGGSMTDAEFFAFLAACREELATKQARFRERIAGGGAWRYDLAGGSLTVGETRYGITAVATLSREHRSWLWAWANDDFPESARADARRLQGLHAVTGFRVFLDRGTPADAADAEDFAALAVHHLDAAGVFRCPSAGPELFLAVYLTDAED